MAATWGPRPTSAASSSTHSWPIRVEVHVGHHDPLLAPRERLDDDVDRFAGEIRRERGAPGVEVSGHDEVGCCALVEPAPALDAAEG